MKKVLVLLVMVLAFNLSNAQEEYKITNMVNNEISTPMKGIVTYIDGILTITPKNKNFPEQVYNLNDWDEIEGAIVIDIVPQGCEVYKSVQTSQVRYTLNISEKYGSYFRIESKDSFTGIMYSSSISFK